MGKRQDLGGDYVPIHITLPKNQHNVVFRYANSNWMSMTSVIRLAVADWIKKNGLNESEVK